LSLAPERIDLERVLAALRASQAAYTEIRLEFTEATYVGFHGRLLETAHHSLDQGGIVRSLAREGGWGVSTFNSLNGLEQRVDQAYQSARLVQGERIKLADVPPAKDEIRAPLKIDFRSIPLSHKKELARAYNDILLSQAKIVDTQLTYADYWTIMIYANSDGTCIVEERPMVAVHMVATARQGNDVQQLADGVSLPAGYEIALGREDMARRLARRTADLLDAQPVAGGVYPVVCDPDLAGVFAHEAFGHLSEADFVYANPQAAEMMVLGSVFGPPNLTIVDDGTLAGLRGTHRYDDEGTPTQRTELMRDGVLVGRMHSRETAARMGERPTGNARAVGYRYAPLVRMTNTYIERGDASAADMIADTQLGVYACDGDGGETMMENFSFSAGYGYMIRDGQLAEMVRDVVLSGNLFSTLREIDAIGNDLVLATKGDCGKGPGSLPVSTGAPHIRIQRVAMGGR
jgi:TldD protein